MTLSPDDECRLLKVERSLQLTRKLIREIVATMHDFKAQAERVIKTWNSLWWKLMLATLPLIAVELARILFK